MKSKKTSQTPTGYQGIGVKPYVSQLQVPSVGAFSSELAPRQLTSISLYQKHFLRIKELDLALCYRSPVLLYVTRMTFNCATCKPRRGKHSLYG
jgi:hypothetical protein